MKTTGIPRRLLRNWRLKALMLGLLVLAFGAGIVSQLLFTDNSQDNLEDHYSLLSRNILSDTPNDVLLNFKPLQQSYQSYLQQNNLSDKVSLYFEYMPTGTTIGINQDRELPAASLIKLPLVTNFYKLVEQGKLSLDTSVALKPAWLNSQYGTLYKKGAGYRLTYRQAINYALQQSDNTAALMLFDAVSQAEGTKTPNILSLIDIDYATNAQQNVLIGAESYSSILKCLYYACYLNKADSQAILTSLTHSDDNQRLTLYTPDNLVVAHKIGTFGDSYQSDCGIFYPPKRKYILCIMVQGQDPAASRVIADLSLTTYDFLVPQAAGN